MTNATSRSPALPEKLAAPWLSAAPLRALFNAFHHRGADIRVVGGAVRNGLLGLPVKDIDLATPLLPDEVMALAQSAGFAVYPTGLAHGTVTVVGLAHSFEVTTLRRDIETTGRHAVVAFTTDWTEDALRRDFTINALLCSADGTITDLVGGRDDLAHRRVRFIGDAHARIREDYLRILRFFRMSAMYGEGPLDATGLAACASLKEGLAQLSAERVRTEVLALLGSHRAADVVATMQVASITTAIFKSEVHVDRLRRLQAIEAVLRAAADPSDRLAALAIDSDADVADVSALLRLSALESEALADALRIPAHIAATASDRDLRQRVYRHGNTSIRRALVHAWAASAASIDDADWQRRVITANSWPAPTMPFSGRDVLALGVPPGPNVGRILSEFEAWWSARDFPDDVFQQRAQLAALVAEMP